MWLGYPGSSGADYMDYIITDKVTSPLHLATQYSEKLAYMPHTFFIGDHRYMFPHLLNKGNGTTSEEALRSIDSQAGVIVINGVIQKPTHPVVTTMKQQQIQQQKQQQSTVQVPVQMSHVLPQQLQLMQQNMSLGMLQAQSLLIHPQFASSLLQQQHNHQLQQQHHNLLIAQQLQQQQQQQLQQQQLKQLQQQQQQQQLVPQSSPAQTAIGQQQSSTTSNVQEPPYTMPTDLPLTTRAQYGLPEGAIVFCNFNQLYKIDPVTFSNWATILKQVPNSVLWLLRFPAAGEGNVIQTAVKLGIPQGRIIFSHVASKEEHVRRGRLADLCLDTPLCNGHTTGMDILWAGTPVLTLPLATLASRVAASQLYALGFPELVAASREDYVQKAVRLGNNPRE